MAQVDKVPGPLRLYIGGLKDLNTLVGKQDGKITHVLSILKMDFVNWATLNQFTHLAIQVDDEESTNLIQYFPKTNQFIQDALDTGGSVFVHCAMGISRSATVVLAYILATFPEHTPGSALALVRQSRPRIDPNVGFMAQLELYHNMSTPQTVEDNDIYQKWLTRHEIEVSRTRRHAPNLRHRMLGDERFHQGSIHKKLQRRTEMTMRCRACGHTLASISHILPHRPPEPPYKPPSIPVPGNPGCSYWFLEPLSWMRPEFEKHALEGNLSCPNPSCHCVLGKYDWDGHACTCGGWVTPAISVLRDSVETPIVKKKREGNL